MQQIYVNGGFHGYTRLMNYISNMAHLGVKDQEIIRYRLKVIEHYEKYGQDSCKDAFDVSRSCVFLWKSQVKQSGGYLSALKKGDTTPLNQRKRNVDGLIVEFIRQYRTEHPGVGKMTLKAVLDAYCAVLMIPTISLVNHW